MSGEDAALARLSSRSSRSQKVATASLRRLRKCGNGEAEDVTWAGSAAGGRAQTREIVRPVIRLSAYFVVILPAMNDCQALEGGG